MTAGKRRWEPASKASSIPKSKPRRAVRGAQPVVAPGSRWGAGTTDSSVSLLEVSPSQSERPHVSNCYKIDGRSTA